MTEMSQDKKYLKVTIHDRDFSDELRSAVEIVHDYFWMYEKYPTEKDFPYLGQCIKNLINDAYCVRAFACEYDNLPNFNEKNSYFLPALSIVKEKDIPNWENGECYYIPLFDDKDILKR